MIGVFAVTGTAKFVTVLSTGIAVGCVGTLVALGFMLIFKATGAVNFAQGSLVTAGGFFAWWGVERRGWSYPVAIAVMVAMIFVVGLGVERFCYAPLRGRSIHVIVIATFAASLIIDQCVFRTIGSKPGTRLLHPPFKGVWRVAGARIPYQNVLMVVVTVVLLVALVLMFSRTQFGRQVRALASNREAARMQGVRVDRMSMLTFGVAAVLSGVGGMLIAPGRNLTTDLGFGPMLTAFAAAVLGGFDSLIGVAVASLILGLAQELGTGYISPRYTAAYPMIVMLAVIALRPRGLFKGTSGRRL